MISVYLSNRTIQVLQGEAGKGRAEVSRVYETLVPEECLINGIITDKDLLREYLRNFWQKNSLPAKHVNLVINSSQFVLKPLEIPKMKPWQLMGVLEKEFSDVERRQDPIYSYRVLAQQKSMVKLLATMAERSFVGGFVELFAQIGVSVTAVNTALGCTVRLLERLPSMKEKTCIVQLLEDNNLTSILWIEGSYEYSSRTRLFSDHGTQSMGTEVSRTVSNLMQFYSSLNREEPIREVYISGLHREDMDYCMDGIRLLGPAVTLLDVQEAVKFSDGAQECRSEDLACLPGSLFRDKKDYNLLTSYRKKRGENQKSRMAVKYIAPVVVTLSVGIGITAGMLVYNGTLQNKADELTSYLTDSVHVEQNSQSTQIEQDLAKVSRKMRAAVDVREALDSYPKMNGELEDAVAGAGGKKVSTEIRSYDGTEGKLTLKASSSGVKGISSFISKLQELGLFREIAYSGYTFDKQKKVYDIDVVCYLAESAGNADEDRDENYRAG